MQDKLFGIPLSEVRRQCKIEKLEGDLKQSPIVSGEFLESCLRGAEKILKDPIMLKRIRNVLVSSKQCEINNIDTNNSSCLLLEETQEVRVEHQFIKRFGKSGKSKKN